MQPMCPRYPVVAKYRCSERRRNISWIHKRDINKGFSLEFICDNRTQVSWIHKWNGFGSSSCIYNGIGQGYQTIPLDGEDDVYDKEEEIQAYRLMVWTIGPTQNICATTGHKIEVAF